MSWTERLVMAVEVGSVMSWTARLVMAVEVGLVVMVVGCCMTVGVVWSMEVGVG